MNILERIVSKGKAVVDWLTHQSQRLYIVAFVTVILLVISAIMGSPGEFPTTPDGSYWTPEFLGNLLVPLTLIVATVYQLFKAVNTRVTSGNIDPNDLKALLTVNEFWVAMVTVTAGFCQVFGVKFLQDAGEQAMLVNVIMGIMTLLVGSNAARPSGQTVMYRGQNAPPPYPTREINLGGREKVA